MTDWDGPMITTDAEAQQSHDARQSLLDEHVRALPEAARLFVERYKPCITLYARCTVGCTLARLEAFVAGVESLVANGRV